MKCKMGKWRVEREAHKEGQGGSGGGDKEFGGREWEGLGGIGRWDGAEQQLGAVWKLPPGICESNPSKDS